MNRRESENRDLFAIADLAREFGISTRAIRFYETKGLLTPERVGAIALAAILALANGTESSREEIPMVFPHKLLARSTQQLFSRRIDVGETPVAVKRKETVSDTLQNSNCLIAGCLGLSSEILLCGGRFLSDSRHLHVRADSSQQFAGGERFYQIVIGACVETLRACLLTGPG